jgi:hypothetical protein
MPNAKTRKEKSQVKEGLTQATKGNSKVAKRVRLALMLKKTSRKRKKYK